MKTRQSLRSMLDVRRWMFDVALISLLLCAASGFAATRYVDVNSASPTPPYTNWATAARVIQDAVDAAAPGDTVLVTNGVYATGGRPVGTNLLVNRVAIEKPIRLASVNGPAVTIIVGARAPAGDEYGNGDGAVRCVYLGLTNAVLSGFTLTNGHTRTTGDWEKDLSGGGVLGGTWDKVGGVLTNCVITGNTADAGGGGAYAGVLQNCSLNGNSAHYGGAAYGGSLYNCTLTGNSAYYGGGAHGGSLYNCTLTGNSADYGGGAYVATLYNCTLTRNSAQYRGGGVYGDVPNDNPSTLNNCIVYFNTAPSGANYDGSSLNHCCTTPLLLGGSGNISADPQLASASHLSASSPCRGAGSATSATGTDIDGEAWANPPSIGCDEYHAGAVTGPLNVAIVTAYTNVAVGFPVELTALIEGRTTASVWEFGDVTTVSNRPYATHAWTTPGDYAVVLQAYNESYPNGVSATVAVHVVSQPVHFVAANSANPVAPYTSLATAATNIQDAVNVATVTGALVLVTNGVYQGGVAVSETVRLRSVNGPEFTLINGGGQMRCVFLGDNALLSGFTLTNGSGGVWCESDGIVTNCLITGNSADTGGGASGGTLYNCTISGNSARYGGGTAGGTLYNCTLSGNQGLGHMDGEGQGGGSAGSTLVNCTVTGNSAQYGGGGAGGTLYNCTLAGNRSFWYGGGASYSTLNNCILTSNTVSELGGGAGGSILNNCTLTGNSAGYAGGGGVRRHA